MKHLLTAIACCLAVAGSAQTPMTYNPDSDGDNFIGVEDLVALLSEFGTTYSPFFYNSEIVPLENVDGFFYADEFAPVFLCDVRPLDYAFIGISEFQPCEGWVVYERMEGVSVDLSCLGQNDTGVAETFLYGWNSQPWNENDSGQNVCL